MAPFRSSRAANRQTRTTQIDHDVFEGLPVRHWRKQAANVGSVPETNVMKPAGVTPNGYPELPLPRDFNMLPENSQALLRAARLGMKRQSEAGEEDKENDEREPARSAIDRPGFLMSKWTLVPRDMEGPEPEYLAKRRKGLPLTHASVDGADGNFVPMRKTKIRRTEADGTTTVWEVLAPEGQDVEGEVVEDDTSPVAAAPGTVVDGVGVVNADGMLVAGEQAFVAPVRRKPPIPKKKKKHGPGRGKKKTLEPVSGEGESNSNDTAQAVDANIDREGSAGEQNENTGEGDSVMHDPHPDDEGSEDGSEDDGDDDREDGELSPSPSALAIQKQRDSPSTGARPSNDVVVDVLESEVASDAPSGLERTSEDANVLASLSKDEKNSISAISGDLSSDKTSGEQILEDEKIDGSEVSLDTAEHAQPHDLLSIDAATSNDKVAPTSPDREQQQLLPTERVPDVFSSVGVATDMHVTSPPPISQTISSFPQPPASTQESSLPPQQVSQQSSSADPIRRPSASSPTAPTPSPPTPIESAFTQPMSPKAPTMSPPTPIPSNLNPPTDADGHEYQNAEPPPLILDSAQGAMPSSIPGLEPFDETQKIDVEAAPSVDRPHFDAEIPHAHDPLQGFTAPDVPPEERRLGATTRKRSTAKAAEE